MIATCIAVYCAIACVTAGALWEVTHDEGITLFGGLFWPVAWLVVVGIGLVVCGRQLVRHVQSGLDQ